MHRLSNLDKTALTGDCEECGPSIKIASYRRPKLGYTGYKCVSGAYRRSLMSKRGNHGLNKTQAADFIFLRGGRCEVCGTDVSVIVDHDHEANVLRGALCRTCNAGLGILGDGHDIRRIEKLLEYVKRTPPSQPLYSKVKTKKSRWEGQPLPKRSMRGESHPCHKLTKQEVILVLTSSLSAKKIAAQLGVSRPLIYRIRRRELWKDIVID